MQDKHRSLFELIDTAAGLGPNPASLFRARPGRLPVCAAKCVSRVREKCQLGISEPGEHLRPFSGQLAGVYAIVSANGVQLGTDGSYEAANGASQSQPRHNRVAAGASPPTGSWKVETRNWRCTPRFSSGSTFTASFWHERFRARTSGP